MQYLIHRQLNALCRPLRCYQRWAGLGLLLLSSSTQASQWHLQLDNDIIYGDDGNYTSGIFLGWSADLQPSLAQAPSWFQWQSLIGFDQAYTHQNWGVSIAQQMWTPAEIELTTPQPYDRPYAGTLAVEGYTATYSDTLAQKNWLAIGVIGPASGNEQLQSFIHKVTGSSAPNGWDHQIENQLTIQVAYEIDKLLLRQTATAETQWELAGFGHAQAGNVRSQTDIGLSLRWGNELASNFGQLSQHSGHVGNITSQSQPNTWFAYTRGFIGYRFNDLTIDGDLPYDNQVKPEKQQAGFDVGIVWAHPKWALTWRFATYTKEYQSDPKDWHGYGSLGITWSL
ncbi:lipid A deacylase LpxR family protein [Shewanella waksmanii]|uniref:lipid A deacylase LpxR family protein n=1 Tax=Shewanella waksmanii TaxID=213783 RepID=UPI003736412B